VTGNLKEQPFCLFIVLPQLLSKGLQIFSH